MVMVKPTAGDVDVVLPALPAAHRELGEDRGAALLDGAELTGARIGQATDALPIGQRLERGAGIALGQQIAVARMDAGELGGEPLDHEHLDAVSSRAHAQPRGNRSARTCV